MNMKKIFLSAAIVLSCLSAKAQSEVGTITLQPKVGINLASMTDAEDSKMKVGLAAGVEGEYQVSNLIGVSAGVMYSMQGVKGESDAKIKQDYINIPILANFYVAKGLALKAGIQPAFLVSSKTSDGNEEVDSKDICNSFDFSIPVGASYEYSNFVLDARYNFGITKVFKSETEIDSKNSVFQITLGYKFAL